MALLIEALQDTDRDFIASLGIELEAVVVLERVEAGSIKAVLRTILREFNDDALQNLDWKPLVGKYLVRGKHAMLRWLADKPTINSREQLAELQGVIVRELPPPVSGQLALPSPPPPEKLLRDIQEISNALQELAPGDSAAFEADGRVTEFNKSLSLSSERIEELLTSETTESQSELRLLVKKPDYLGRSRWEFKYDDHVIEARIEDEDWLQRFRDGDVVLRPGDALVALVRSSLNRGFEGNVVAVHYIIVRVLGVARGQTDDQSALGDIF
jgi:hypothetical protein